MPENDKVNGCNITTVGDFWLQDGSNYLAHDVDLPYYGLGAFVDLDDDGTLEFVHMMASKQSGEGSTSQVLYNQFVKQ